MGATKKMGKRSRKKPSVTGKNFFLGARPITLATKICGKKIPAQPIKGMRPINRGLSVKWLTNNGRMIVEEKKLIPNHQLAPSRAFTMKFQRKFRSICC